MFSLIIDEISKAKWNHFNSTSPWNLAVWKLSILIPMLIQFTFSNDLERLDYLENIRMLEE